MMEVLLVILAAALAIAVYRKIFHSSGRVWFGTTGFFIKSGFVIFVIMLAVVYYTGRDIGLIKEDGYEEEVSLEDGEDYYDDSAASGLEDNETYENTDVMPDSMYEDTYVDEIYDSSVLDGDTIQDENYKGDVSGDGLQDDAGTEFIFADSSERYLEDWELELCSSSELSIARNEIYARHGRRFNDQTLQEYFDSMPWYEGTVAPEDFDDGVFNEFEKANLEKITVHE